MPVWALVTTVVAGILLVVVVAAVATRRAKTAGYSPIADKNEFEIDSEEELVTQR
jgi:hypothetical protein